MILCPRDKRSKKGKELESVEARIGAALERAGYAGRGVLLVVGVSGGADSLALLHSLVSLRENAGLRLHVAHLNHNFRAEAEEDARFVSEAAHDLGLPATVGRADPIAYQKEMAISSFEDAAREVRYDFLAGVARDNAAGAVALGHNADDLAETVLMHVIRGSGVYGLQGMSEVSAWRSRAGNQSAVLFRPMLGVTKSETAAYCRDRGIVFREDPGNLLLRFTRNQVRHRLLPSLEAYNPRIREALVRLAHSASLEVDYLERELAQVWPAVAVREGNSITLDARLLDSLHPLMRRLVLRRAYQELAGDTRRLEQVHLKAMGDFAEAPPGKALELPRGWRLYSGYGRLTLAPASAPASEGPSCPFPPLAGEHEVPLSPSRSANSAKIVQVPGWRIEARMMPLAEVAKGDPFTACFDLESMGDKLRVRTRTPGDRFQPLGMRSEKKLQDFYVDEKVPRAWRDRVPLLVSERGIAWVVGYRLAEWARVGESTRQVCQVRFTPL